MFDLYRNASDDERKAFASLGSQVDPKSVPHLVRAGIDVWSFGYAYYDDEDFTTIGEDDLWAFETDSDVVDSWGPFAVDLDATAPVEVQAAITRATAECANTGTDHACDGGAACFEAPVR